MKSLTKTLFTLGLTYAITATPLFAQIFTFDENGNINMNGGPDPVPVPFQVAPDPSGGIAANVLIYQLPFVVTPGDVALLEPGQTSSTPSDLVRFFSPAGANFSDIIFYSDIEPGEPNTDLADTGLPVSPNAFPIPEVGPEGNNGATWNPVPGQPGSAPTGVNIQYNIISDVPEPSVLMLAALSGGLLLLTLKRRHQARI
ncbi:MAG TPA: hypothetical protein VGY56_03745 [Verrucomicrobiae bacterium]|nr:hypothetical protein [Verrucomicrobiae bacterium]